MATNGPSPPPNSAIDPADAQGAQVPLRDFNIPEFPPAARAFKALTLTSDIKVDEYQATLTQPFSLPASLPIGIESLTLELFSLGYPAGFLTQLATRLPNLRSLVVYSQLFAGISAESAADAVEFFRRLPGLRALHLLDVFARPGFFGQAASWVRYDTSDEPGAARRGLMFLEVNYTFRHEDPEFMDKICASELPELIGPGLVSCSLNISPPESAEDDPDDPTNIENAGSKEGVMAFNKTIAVDLLAALTAEKTAPQGLRALNTTLYTFTLEHLKKLLEVQSHVMLLNVCVEMEPGEESKKQLIEALGQCKNLEQVEIVCNPSLQFFMAVQSTRNSTLTKTFPSQGDMDAVSKNCQKLSSFKADVLRTKALGQVEWRKQDGKWTGGVTEGQGLGLATL